MFVIWLIPTQFFQLILYKFIALGFLGWSPLIFGLLPKFGPYNWRCLWEITGVILSFTLDDGRFRFRPSRVFRVSTSRSFPWSRVKKTPGGKCMYHPYQWESISEIVATSASQGLLPANLHHMMKVVILSAETEFRPRVAWETTLWVKRLIKFSSHLSHVGSRREDFLGSSLSPHSLCTTVEQTP